MSIAEPTVNEPFLLANYGHSQRLMRDRDLHQPNIHATHTTQAGGKKDGYVTVTAQGDGVYVLDVGTLRPVISYTLGPSASFACPAVTTHVVKPSEKGEAAEKDKIFTTYAVIHTPPSAESEGAIDSSTLGRTVWMWKENLSQSLVDRGASASAVKKKREVQAPYPVASLSTCSDLQNRVIGLSPSGQIMIWDAELQLKQTRNNEKHGERDLWKSLVFPRQGCDFILSRMENVPVRGALITLVWLEKEEVELEILVVDEQDVVTLLGMCKINVKTEDLVDMTCSNSGDISVLARDGTWYTHRLEPSSDFSTIQLSPSTDSIQLTGMSFISSSTPVDTTSSSNQSSKNKKSKTNPTSTTTTAVNAPTTISLLSLRSSLVLLAAITSQNPEILLLIWDSQFSVVLASYSLPIPSALTQSKEMGIEIRLVPTGQDITTRKDVHDGVLGDLRNSQALLLLSTVPLSTSSTSSPSMGNLRSSVLVVPFVVPLISTIAGALGKAGASAKWIKGLSHGLTVGAAGAGGEKAGYDEKKTKLMQTMRNAMEQNRPQAATSAFLEWEKQETSRAMENKENANAAFPLESSTPELGYSFVKDVLHTVLQPHKPANAPYSSELVRLLIKRGSVSSSMFDGGFLRVLMYKEDWPSIELALEHIRDLSEVEIIEALKIVILNHLRQHPHPDAMQVDQPATPISIATSSIPSLPSFLALCISYPPPPPTSSIESVTALSLSSTLSTITFPTSLSSSTKAQIIPYLASFSSSSSLLSSSSSPSSSTAAQPLRKAIQRHILNPDELVAVLKILEGWIGKWRNTPVKLIPNKREMVLNSELGVWVARRSGGQQVKMKTKGKKKKGKKDKGGEEGEEADEADEDMQYEDVNMEQKEVLPSLEKTIAFTQTIIDSSFLLLIQHKPSHALLRHLSSLIEPEIFYSEQVENLRGSLRTFVVKQERVVREAVEGKLSKERGTSAGVGTAGGSTGKGEKDWRQRKRQMHEQQSMGVGLYRLEELVL